MSKTFEDELYHYGVKGMKRGIRRYQNEDGSLTAAGRAHYNVRVGEIGERSYGDRRTEGMRSSAMLNINSQSKSVDRARRKNDKFISKSSNKFNKLAAKKLTNRRQNKMNKLNDAISTAKSYNRVLSKRKATLDSQYRDVKSRKAVAGRDYITSSKGTKSSVIRGILGGPIGRSIGPMYQNTRVTWDTKYMKNRKKRK